MKPERIKRYITKEDEVTVEDEKQETRASRFMWQPGDIEFEEEEEE